MNLLFGQQRSLKVNENFHQLSKSFHLLIDNIFYMQEYREQIYLLLKDYDNTKMTK